jgi:hypothetical protein
MEYQFTLIAGDGNCLFRSVSYLIFGTQKEHRNIRLRVVNFIINNWDVYKKNFHCLSNKLPIYNYNNYEHLSSFFIYQTSISDKNSFCYDHKQSVGSNIG